MYFAPYDHSSGDSNNNNVYPPLTTHTQMVYPRGTLMYNNTSTTPNPSLQSPLKDNNPKAPPANTEHKRSSENN